VRITWFSNTPLAGTGYGVQTAEIVPRLVADGHQVAIAANWGQYGAAIEWNGIPIYPAGKDKYSNDIARAHHAHWRGDWMITLYDVWPLVRREFPERVASWVPVDHQPVPPEVSEWAKTVTPIAMSRFGQRMLRDQDIESTYIPHSVNTEIFKPTPALTSGRTPREMLGIPADAFVIVIAAANQGIAPPRKAWGEMFLAASYFMRQHPDAYLYVHSDRTQTPPGGLDLPMLELAVQMPTDRIAYTDAYAYASGQIGQADLSALYSMGDVLLASSMGEGFGIPVIEAQACGVPVIVSDFSAQPELAASGWLVKGQPSWDALQGSFYFTPLVGSIIDRLTEAYAARGLPEPREAAIAKAAEYDTTLVYDRYWRPFLRELDAQLPKPNRAERRARK